MTKGYTLNYFVNLFNSTGSKSISNAKEVYTFVSPRLGFNSVRGVVLDQWLGGVKNTRAIANGTGRFSTYGSTPRARLLKALRNRKTTGSV